MQLRIAYAKMRKVVTAAIADAFRLVRRLASRVLTLVVLSSAFAMTVPTKPDPGMSMASEDALMDDGDDLAGRSELCCDVDLGIVA